MSEKIDLLSMTVDELKYLQNKLVEVINDKEETDVLKYKKTNEFKKLKSEFNELKKVLKTFSKEIHEIDVEIPIKFKVVARVEDFADVVNIGKYLSVGDVFTTDIKGKITGNFNKNVLEFMQDQLDVICDEACEEILRLKPGAYEKLEDFVKVIKKFFEKLEGSPVTAMDFIN